MKKIISLLLVFICIIFSGCSNLNIDRSEVKPYVDEVSYYSKLDGKYFSLYDGEECSKIFVKGVNIGAGKPGYYPGELAITKEEYLRWFKEISEMNANSIRVYTILKPEFYEALYEYNRDAEKPLYLFHGLWINENDIAEIANAYDPKIKEQVENDIKDLIDVIHGKTKIEEKAGHASGKYEYDISPYVIGWILGIEWDPEFVINTEEINKTNNSFKGEYLYTENASSFETFLCEFGDTAIKYETEKYKTQRPLSFTNWVTTDMLEHPNEPMAKEDMVTVNTENIKHSDKFKPGLFASYHIYPYYPDSMNYQEDYVEFVDEDGNVNTYKAYLRDLIKEHTVPVLVGEFGVPSSRGMGHINKHTGFNQGNIDEKTQGEMDSSMLKDIYDEGYAGGLIFTWQDEWFKRTWNNMDFDIPDRRAYWSNTQTNEQEFGLLAFDPGVEESAVYVDGEIEDWKRQDPIIENDNLSMYVKNDEKYLYIMMKSKDFDFEKNRMILPIDITSKSGSNTFENISFNRDADFIIDINGKENSSIKVHSYYDVFYYMYGKKLKMIEENKEFEQTNSNIFNPIYLCLNRELKLPQDNKILPFEKYETGKLVFGNGNPNSNEYNSLADFYITKDVLEIRIPYQLLNIMDPSSKKVMDDFYEDDIKPMDFKNIYIGANGVSDKSNIKLEIQPYTWANWDIPIYHERLKQSYYILQEAMQEIGEELESN